MSLLVQEPFSGVDSETLLSEVLKEIREATSLPVAIESVSPKILKLLDAERVTIYRRDKQSGEMVSRFNVSDRQQEVRLSNSTTSIAGYCALTRQVVNVEDVYDAQVLTKIHPKLVFQGFFDRAYGFRTRAILVAPILFNDALLGVLQIINRRSGGSFNQAETSMVLKIASELGEKVRQELHATSGPYVHLVHSGCVSKGDMDNIQRMSVSQMQPVSRLLVRELGVDATEIGKSLEHFFQIPYMPYDPAIVIPEILLQGIKKSYLRTCGWLPIAGDRNEVTVLIDDPSDAGKLREIMRLINAQVYHFKISLPEDMLRYLGQESVAPVGSTGFGVAVGSPDTKIRMTVDADDSDPAAVQLVNQMLQTAAKLLASSIHVEPAGGGMPTSVRFKANGNCALREEIPSQMHGAVIARVKGISNLDLLSPHKPQSGRFSMPHEGKTLEFQVALVPTVNGESLVLQSLAPRAKLLTLDELSLSGHNLEIVKKILSRSSGFFLVVGPASSGKTSTLHAMLSRLNTTDRTIWTVEDPVEIVQEGLQQVQTDPKSGLSYADTLSSVMLCDPDTILIGDMRKGQTASIAIDAALSGHLVLSAMSSTSATEALRRLMDWGLDAGNVADAVLGVMSQRLVRKLCSSCKKTVPLSSELLDEIKALYGEGFDVECASYLGKAAPVFRRGACSACHETGFDGYMAIQELLLMSSELKRRILRGEPLEYRGKASMQSGAPTLIQDHIVKVLQGHLDLDEIRGFN